MSSIFDRIDPDSLLKSDGKGGYKSPVRDAYVDWDDKAETYRSEDKFVNYNEETGTYESKEQQDSREKYPTPSTETEEAYSHPSTRGASLTVINSLKNITFVDGSVGGMSNSIAYIRYWSRNGTQQKTPVVQNATNGAPKDSQEELEQEINDVYGGEYESVLALDGELSQYQTDSAYQSRPRQPLPTNTSYQEFKDTEETNNEEVDNTSKPSSSKDNLGKIFSANPGGTPSPTWQNPFYSPPSAPDPAGAVWQFLFNPEELQLTSGPDYNRAETWGVSDPKNSGQPLSWRSNKNRRLVFNRVLLHGYTFGKRVNSLEDGLQDLFMARNNNLNTDGPPILEFVWGQRIFGPCVIQNIQVREQAWDKGLLVNAEVSFELEQIPEWTINDGFVDVTRPGRMGLVNDPLLSDRTTGTTGTTGTTTTPTTPTTPTTSTTPATTSGRTPSNNEREKELKALQNVCFRTEKVYRIFLRFLKDISRVSPNVIGTKEYLYRFNLQTVSNLVIMYRHLISVLKNEVPGSSKLIQIYDPAEVQVQTNEYFKGDPNNPNSAKRKSLDFLRKASEAAGKIAKDYYTSETCKRVPEELDRLRKAEKNKNEKLYECSSIKENSPCTIGAGEVRVNPCDKKNYRCVVKDRNPGVTVYRQIR